MADILNETEILIGYWKSWCSHGIALLFRDNNPVRLTGMQSSHSYKSATCRSTVSAIKLFVQRFGSIYFRERGAGGISFQAKYTLVLCMLSSAAHKFYRCAVRVINFRKFIQIYLAEMIKIIFVITLSRRAALFFLLTAYEKLNK